MYHALTHFTSTHKSFYRLLILGAIILFVALSAIFFITRGSVPHTSELAFIEHSRAGESAGSVIPASCNSDPHFAGDCAPPAPPTVSIMLYAGPAWARTTAAPNGSISIPYGGFATFGYGSTHANSCTLYYNSTDASSWGGGLGYTWHDWGPHFTTGTFQVYCSGPGGNVWSPTVTLIVLPEVPPVAPVYVGGSPSVCDTGTLYVNWNRPAGATSYTLRDGGTVIYTGPDVSFTHTGLTLGSSHSYSVMATNNAGSSAYSSVFVYDAPSPCMQPPANLTATPGQCAVVPGSIHLSWDPVPTATDYVLSAYGSTIYQGPLTSFTHSGLAEGQYVGYEVKAIKQPDFGPYEESNSSPQVMAEAPSNLCLGPLEAPVLTGVDGGCGSSQIILSWDPINNALDYDIRRGDGFGPIIGTTAANTFTFNTPNPPNQSIPYTFTVRGTNNQFPAGPWWSNAVTVYSPRTCTARPNTPAFTSVTPGSCGTDYIDVSWSTPAQAATYELSANGVVVYSGSATSYRHISGPGNFAYRVQAINMLGASPQSAQYLANGPHPDCQTSPNIASGAVTLNSGTLIDGEVVTFASDVLNTQSDIVNNFNYDFRYRWNDTDSWARIGLGYLPINILWDYERQTNTSNPFTLNRVGTLQVQHCVDSYVSSLSEISEDDNCAIGLFTVTPPPPNLASGPVIQNGGTLNNGSTASFRSAFRNLTDAVAAETSFDFSYRWGFGGPWTPLAVANYYATSSLYMVPGNIEWPTVSSDLNLAGSGPIQVQHCVDSFNTVPGESDDIDNCAIETFNIAAHVPPTVNAGPNKSIVSPASNSGPTGTSASDPSGISSVEWTFVSGPSTPVITSGNTLTPAFSSLTSVGAYEFRLTATSTAGIPNSDTMFVTVLPAPPSGIITATACLINIGSSTCPTNVTWGSANFIGSPSVRQGVTQFSTDASNATGVSRDVSPADRTFTLRDMGGAFTINTLADAQCQTGGTWVNALNICVISPRVDIEADPNIVRSGSRADVAIEIDADYTLTCTISGGIDQTFTHTASVLPAQYTHTTEPLTAAQVITVYCESSLYPEVVGTDEVRVNVIPTIQEI
jgi:hypothetical protein